VRFARSGRIFVDDHAWNANGGAAFAILAGIVMEKADHRSDTLERLEALRRPARLGQTVQIDA